MKINMIKAVMLVSCGWILSACANHLPYTLDSHHVAKSQDERIKYIILHYTDETEDASLRILSQGKVSAHYLVGQPRDGHKPIVYRLVPDYKRAWHAGLSNWRGRTNLNDSSIGIEIVNEGCQEQKREEDISIIGRCQPFDQMQIKAVLSILDQLVKRYQILPENIIGHSDIAPSRKIDPGPLFPWQELAEHGFGVWPDPKKVAYFLGNRSPKDLVDVRSLQELLFAFGYTGITQSGELDVITKAALRAFQLHFRPSDISGRPDAQTMALLQALLIDRPAEPSSSQQHKDTYLPHP
jgi:ybjR